MYKRGSSDKCRCGLFICITSEGLKVRAVSRPYLGTPGRFSAGRRCRMLICSDHSPDAAAATRDLVCLSLQPLPKEVTSPSFPAPCFRCRCQPGLPHLRRVPSSACRQPPCLVYQLLEEPKHLLVLLFVWHSHFIPEEHLSLVWTQTSCFSSWRAAPAPTGLPVSPSFIHILEHQELSM